MSKKNNIYVIGHKNPDTDSICSAISYAYLKNELSQKQEEECKYIPTRAGHINEETQYVLRYFEQEAPLFVNDIRPQVTDIEIRKTEGVDAGLSLKSVGYHERSTYCFLPIIEEGNLQESSLSVISPILIWMYMTIRSYPKPEQTIRILLRRLTER